ncbi:MAG: glycosyltransferase family 2 protein, partial [Candidatus Hydrogenedentota bacterium]
EQLVTKFDDDATVGVGGTYGIANPRSPLARVVHEEIQVRHKRFGDMVDFLGSFNVAYVRQAFDAASGFDEDFRFASAEDNDLAYRLLDNGGVLRFNPNAVVDHYHPERLGPYLQTQMRHGFWRMKLYAKHPRRTSGDQYAGPSALLGPPLALLTLALTIALGATVAFGHNPFVAVIVFVPAAFSFACHGIIRAKLSA